LLWFENGLRLCDIELFLSKQVAVDTCFRVFASVSSGIGDCMGVSVSLGTAYWLSCQ